MRVKQSIRSIIISKNRNHNCQICFKIVSNIVELFNDKKQQKQQNGKANSLMKFHFLVSEDIHDFHLPYNFTYHIEKMWRAWEDMKIEIFLPFFWRLSLGHYIQYYRSLRHTIIIAQSKISLSYTTLSLIHKFTL